MIILLVCLSCAKDETTIEQNEALSVTDTNWQSNPEYGYYKMKTVNGFNIGGTYLPASFLLAEELDKREETIVEEKDSLEQNYSNSVHFIMEIESDGERNKGNFLYKDIYGLDDFTDNVNYYNFSIIEDISVQVNGTPFKVVLSNMENTYTLSDNRKIHFVAVPPTQEYGLEAKPIQELLFVYDDEMLGIGRTQFTFRAQDFKTIPTKI
jgi:hypothetical protein